MNDLTAARAFFAQDRYSMEVTGIRIDAVEDHFSRVSLPLEARHKNAFGNVMGGVICTIADFAFAVATNDPEHLTVTVVSQQNFLSPSHGSTLYAECHAVREGRRNCFYQVDVTDDLGTHVALVTFTGAHVTPTAQA